MSLLLLHINQKEDKLEAEKENEYIIVYSLVNNQGESFNLLLLLLLLIIIL